MVPPTRLDDAAREIWARLAPDLERMNFLRATDVHAFARYCSALTRYYKVTEDLHAKGETYTSASAHGTLERIHPLFVVQERLAKRLESLEDRFGLNPAARQQIMMRLAQHQPQLPLAAPNAEKQPEQSAAPEPPVAASPMGFLNTPQRLN
ncbi:phage terminase small subunit P27 family [Teichococcus aestuarii]|uniref:phage terminase small subunit P27 family n=1 Tax=Teichococcus aestuarii TaxID=568898 RepID=UPI0036147313